MSLSANPDLQTKLQRIVTSIAALAVSLIASALPPDYFTTESLTSSGKWMKVAVKESGIYELTFEELREMGFSNPEEVGIYGYDTWQMPEDFTDISGNARIPEQAKAIPAIHKSDKLIFYAHGVENITTVKTTGSFGSVAFDRTGRNVYSSYIWYLVGEKGFTQMAPSSNEADISDAVPLSYGIDYFYHENPLYHCYFDDGTSRGANTGRLYYGELLSGQDVSFPVTLNNITSGKYVQVKGSVFFEPYKYGTSEKRDSFGLRLGSGVSMSVAADKDFYIKPQQFSYSLQYPGTSMQYRFSKSAEFSGRFAHLGYFLISYYRNIPTDFDTFDQAHLMFTDLAENESGYFHLPDDNVLGFDITAPGDTRLLVPADDSRRIILTNTGSYPEIVLFDTEKEHKKVFAKRPVSSNNLRQRATQGADMLIVCVPALKNAALRLAEIHAATDGVKVTVATTTEIYDDFSAGTPDPMAVRSLVRMMSDNSRIPLRNILLMGPYRANPRLLGQTSDETGAVSLPYDSSNPLPEFNCIIAWQDDGIYFAEYGADSFAEFYALTDDVIPDKYYESKPKIGVGVLPCNSLAEADNAISKIERFLTDNSYAYTLNKMMAIGGNGDEQIHARCALEAIETSDKNLNNALIGTPVLVDALPKGDATRLFVNTLNKGCILSTYFGHGSSLQMAEYFFSSADLTKMKNNHLPFMCFFGCDITQTDRLIRGIGEKMVMASEYGLIGGLVSIRKTHDNVNRNIYSYFINAMTNDVSDPDAPARLRPLTLGEATSAWKSYFNKVENGRYILIGDPSITLPLPTLGVSTEISQAQGYVSLKGTITDNTGNKSDNFNGNCVVRILSAPVTSTSSNYISGDETKLTYTVQDVTVALKETTVANGSFSLTIPIPQESLASDTLTLAIAAYDPEQRLAAASKLVETGIRTEIPDFSKDTFPPVIESLEYDNQKNAAVITVRDEASLTLTESPLNSRLSIYIDGKFIDSSTTSSVTCPADNSYRKTIALPLLHDGNHILRARAKDDAGNETWRELSFITGNDDGSLRLVLSEKALIDEISVTVMNNLSDTNVYLYIEKASGEIIDILSIDNDFKWGGELTNGHKLPTGVYRLHVKSRSGAFSPAIEMPVIRKQ